MIRPDTDDINQPRLARGNRQLKSAPIARKARVSTAIYNDRPSAGRETERRVVIVHGRPHIAKHSRSDDQEVKIAPVHPDFCCERCSLSLMGSAGRHLDRLRALGVLR